MEKFNLRYFKPTSLIILVGVLVLLLYLANQYISEHWGVSLAVFGSIIGAIKFIDAKLWNIWPFKFLYSVPDFTGRYEGFLESEYRNGKCEKVTKKLEHTKVIVQNGSDIVINSWTKKEDGNWSSKSESINASIEKNRDGTFYLLYNYLNDGSSEQDLSRHYGTEKLKLIKNGDGKHLVGDYYTERMPFLTKGKIKLKFINKDLSHVIF